HARFGAADLEQNEEDQRLLEKIVAERRKELGPKQRRKAARQQQGRRHRGLILCGGPIISMKALGDIHDFGLWTAIGAAAEEWASGARRRRRPRSARTAPTHRSCRWPFCRFRARRSKIVPQARCLFRDNVAAQGLCRSSNDLCIAMNDVHAYTLP